MASHKFVYLASLMSNKQTNKLSTSLFFFLKATAHIEICPVCTYFHKLMHCAERKEKSPYSALNYTFKC